MRSEMLVGSNVVRRGDEPRLPRNRMSELFTYGSVGGPAGQPAGSTREGTPQLYLPFVVGGRSAPSSNCSVGHGGAPELSLLKVPTS